MHPLRLCLIPLSLSGAAAAQPVVLEPLRVVPSSRCAPEQAADGEAIVVCGSREANERHRVPEAVREAPAPQAGTSWTARQRDLGTISRYEDQVSGPGAAYRNSAETICKWRAERREMEGLPPDCSRKFSPAPRR